MSFCIDVMLVPAVGRDGGAWKGGIVVFTRSVVVDNCAV